MTASENSPLFRSLFAVNDVSSKLFPWICERNKSIPVEVELAPWKNVADWEFDSISGDLRHNTGKFFAITGLDVFVNDGKVKHWTQPIIYQPEVGYLGILAKEFGGVTHFLMQAKVEPGNVNCVQISPTLQATRSNYTRVHGGKKPAFLELFQKATRNLIMLDQLQSEQGARFYRKRNRNIIIKTTEEIPPHPDFMWMTLGQIKRLMRFDNVVNMDTRTVISGLKFQPDPEASDCNVSEFGKALMASEQSMSGTLSIDEILYWLSDLKSKYELVVSRIPLNQVEDWLVTDSEIVRHDRKYFRVAGANISIGNREVVAWSQPLVEPMQEGLCVLFAKNMNGILHFLLQAKIECGNFDVVELSPTIQCLTGNYDETKHLVYFLEAFLSGGIIKNKIFDTKQSEEGGRFYKEQNRNVIVEVCDAFDEDVPERFCWMTLGQIKEFLRYNNYLNIQVRSLISALEYCND